MKTLTTTARKHWLRCAGQKKRRRRLLKSVKQLSREQEIDTQEKEKRRKRATFQVDTTKQDITDQKKITESAFNGIKTLHMFREYCLSAVDLKEASRT